MRSIGGEWEAQEQGAFEYPRIQAPNVGVKLAGEEGPLATAPLWQCIPVAQAVALGQWMRNLPRLRAA